VNATVDAATRQVKVYVTVSNSDRRLVGGLYASGRIVLSQVAGAIAVPPTAIRRDASNTTYVLIVDHERIARRDVAGVDPRLGEAGGGERAGGQLARDPHHANVGVARPERGAEILDAACPPIANGCRWRAAFAFDHDRGTFVDRSRAASAGSQLDHHLREAPARAGDCELVRLREMQHDVGDRPRLARRGSLPVVLRHPVEQL
jgi:hypothetical protein